MKENMEYCRHAPSVFLDFRISCVYISSTAALNLYKNLRVFMCDRRLLASRRIFRSPIKTYFFTLNAGKITTVLSIKRTDMR